jgi:hypothetical protein
VGRLLWKTTTAFRESFAAAAGITMRYINKAVQAMDALVGAPRMVTESYFANRTGRFTGTPEVGGRVTEAQKNYDSWGLKHVAFMENNTHTFSGQSNATVKLLIPHHVLLDKLHAQTPEMLRAWANENPAFVQMLRAKSLAGTGVFTRLEADVKTALWAAEQLDFSLVTEYNTRYTASSSGYADRLAAAYCGKKKAVKTKEELAPSPTDSLKFSPDDGEHFDDVLEEFGADECITEDSEQLDPVRVVVYDRTSHRRQVSTFDPATHSIASMAPATFYSCLKRHGLKYSTCKKETRCPIHDNGPVQEKQLARFTSDLAAVQIEIDASGADHANLSVLLKQKTVLLGNVRDLTPQVTLYHIHLRQYQTQRSTVADILHDLPVGHVVCFRDFVNSYNENGKHIKNLQLVFRWRDLSGGPLRCFKVANLCGDPDTQSCDVYFYKDVMEHYLRSKEAGEFGLLARASKLYIVGDHGPHFSAKLTAWAESTWHARFNIEVEPVFLCSYHAYNPCDGAGAECTRLWRTQAKTRRGGYTDVQLRDMINDSESNLNLAALAFPVIARGADIFPSVKRVTDAVCGLRKMCHLLYGFTNEHGLKEFQEGIVLCKLVSTDPKWTVVDLLKRDATKGEAPLCCFCSDHYQRPVFGLDHHLTAECRAYADETIINRKLVAGMQPSGSRPGLEGPQLTKAAKKKAKNPTKAKNPSKQKVPDDQRMHCREPTCTTALKTFFGINKHMRQHELLGLGPYKDFTKVDQNACKAATAAAAAGDAADAVPGAPDGKAEAAAVVIPDGKAEAAAPINKRKRNCKRKRDEEEEDEDEDESEEERDELGEEKGEEDEEEEEEEEGTEDEEAVEGETDEEEEGDAGKGWEVVGILGERWFLDKRGASREYELLYEKYEFPASEKWRDANAQDEKDMPPKVLSKWRATNAPDSVIWVKGRGVTASQVTTAKAKYLASLAPASSSSAAPAAPLPLPPPRLS